MGACQQSAGTGLCFCDLDAALLGFVRKVQAQRRLGGGDAYADALIQLGGDHIAFGGCGLFQGVAAIGQAGEAQRAVRAGTAVSDFRAAAVIKRKGCAGKRRGVRTPFGEGQAAEELGVFPVDGDGVAGNGNAVSSRYGLRRAVFVDGHDEGTGKAAVTFRQGFTDDIGTRLKTGEAYGSAAVGGLAVLYLCVGDSGDRFKAEGHP